MSIAIPDLIHARRVAVEHAIADCWDEALDLLDAQRLAWRQALDLLDAQRLAWRQAHPYEMAATTAATTAPRPVLRLLLAPQWSRGLRDQHKERAGEHPTVLLQGRDDDLYLRVVSAQAPALVQLEVVPDGGRGFPVACQRLAPAAGPFALPALNGGEGLGSLWYVPGISAGAVLGGDGARLRLYVAMLGGARPDLVVPVGGRGEESATCLEIPPLYGVRVGHDEPDPGKAETWVRRAVAAYGRADGADDFARAVHWFAETDGRFRELRRWQALWMRAMLAELRRAGDRTWRRYAGPLSQNHPQLRLDGW